MKKCRISKISALVLAAVLIFLSAGGLNINTYAAEEMPVSGDVTTSSDAVGTDTGESVTIPEVSDASGSQNAAAEVQDTAEETKQDTSSLSDDGTPLSSDDA